MLLTWVSHFSFELIHRLTRREKPETPETTASQGLGYNLNTDELFGMHDVLRRSGMQYLHLFPVPLS